MSRNIWITLLHFSAIWHIENFVFKPTTDPVNSKFTIWQYCACGLWKTISFVDKSAKIHELPGDLAPCLPTELRLGSTGGLKRPQTPRSNFAYASKWSSYVLGVNIILLQLIKFHIEHLYRQFTLIRFLFLILHCVSGLP